MHIALSRSLFEENIAHWPYELAEGCGWILHQVSFPVIDCEFTRSDRTPIRVILNFIDWDEQPPSVSLNNSTGELLANLLPNPTGVFNPSAHPIINRPFICMAGTKEYHTHPSHLNDHWEQYRGKPGFAIGDILMKIWHAWLKGSN